MTQMNMYHHQNKQEAFSSESLVNEEECGRIKDYEVLVSTGTAERKTMSQIGVTGHKHEIDNALLSGNFEDISSDEGEFSADSEKLLAGDETSGDIVLEPEDSCCHHRGSAVDAGEVRDECSEETGLLSSLETKLSPGKAFSSGKVVENDNSPKESAIMSSAEPATESAIMSTEPETDGKKAFMQDKVSDGNENSNPQSAENGVVVKKLVNGLNDDLFSSDLESSENSTFSLQKVRNQDENSSVNGLCSNPVTDDSISSHAVVLDKSKVHRSQHIENVTLVSQTQFSNNGEHLAVSLQETSVCRPATFLSPDQFHCEPQKIEGRILSEGKVFNESSLTEDKDDVEKLLDDLSDFDEDPSSSSCQEVFGKDLDKSGKGDPRESEVLLMCDKKSVERKESCDEMYVSNSGSEKNGENLKELQQRFCKVDKIVPSPELTTSHETNFLSGKVFVANENSSMKPEDLPYLQTKAEERKLLPLGKDSQYHSLQSEVDVEKLLDELSEDDRDQLSLGPDKYNTEIFSPLKTKNDKESSTICSEVSLSIDSEMGKIKSNLLKAKEDSKESSSKVAGCVVDEGKLLEELNKNCDLLLSQAKGTPVLESLDASKEDWVEIDHYKGEELEMDKNISEQVGSSVVVSKNGCAELREEHESSKEHCHVQIEKPECAPDQALNEIINLCASIGKQSRKNKMESSEEGGDLQEDSSREPRLMEPTEIAEDQTASSDRNSDGRENASGLTDVFKIDSSSNHSGKRMSCLAPGYYLPSATTCTQDLLPDCNQMMSVVRQSLKGPSKKGPSHIDSLNKQADHAKDTDLEHTSNQLEKESILTDSQKKSSEGVAYDAVTSKNIGRTASAQENMSKDVGVEVAKTREAASSCQSCLLEDQDLFSGKIQKELLNDLAKGKTVSPEYNSLLEKKDTSPSSANQICETGMAEGSHTTCGFTDDLPPSSGFSLSEETESENDLNLMKPIKISIVFAEGKFTCSTCSFTGTGSKFREHVMQHLLGHPYKCLYCLKLFAGRSEITEHIEEDHPESPIRCALRASGKAKELLNEAKRIGTLECTVSKSDIFDASEQDVDSGVKSLAKRNPSVVNHVVSNVSLSDAIWETSEALQSNDATLSGKDIINSSEDVRDVSNKSPKCSLVAHELLPGTWHKSTDEFSGKSLTHDSSGSELSSRMADAVQPIKCPSKEVTRLLNSGCTEAKKSIPESKSYISPSGKSGKVSLKEPGDISKTFSLSVESTKDRHCCEKNENTLASKTSRNEIKDSENKNTCIKSRDMVHHALGAAMKTDLNQVCPTVPNAVSNSNSVLKPDLSLISPVSGRNELYTTLNPQTVAGLSYQHCFQVIPVKPTGQQQGPNNVYVNILASYKDLAQSDNTSNRIVSVSPQLSRKSLSPASATLFSPAQFILNLVPHNQQVVGGLQTSLHCVSPSLRSSSFGNVGFTALQIERMPKKENLQLTNKNNPVLVGVSQSDRLQEHSQSILIEVKVGSGLDFSTKVQRQHNNKIYTAFIHGEFVCCKCCLKWKNRDSFWFHVWNHLHLGGKLCNSCERINGPLEEINCAVTDAVLENLVNYSSKTEPSSDFCVRQPVSDSRESHVSVIELIPGVDGSSQVMVYCAELFEKSVDYTDEVKLLGDIYPSDVKANCAIACCKILEPFSDKSVLQSSRFHCENSESKKLEIKIDCSEAGCVKNSTGVCGGYLSGERHEGHQFEDISGDASKDNLSVTSPASDCYRSFENNLKKKENKLTSGKVTSFQLVIPENGMIFKKLLPELESANDVPVKDDAAIKNGFFLCVSNCNFSCFQSTTFKKHLQECHAQMKSFQCFHCGFTGANPDILMHHYRMHSLSSQPEHAAYSCVVEDCQFTSNIVEAFYKHTLNSHPHLSSYVCKDCEQEYWCLEDLMEHLKSNTLCVVTCQHCSAKGTDSQIIRKHIQDTHPGAKTMLYVVKQLLCKARLRFQHQTGQESLLQQAKDGCLAAESDGEDDYSLAEIDFSETLEVASAKMKTCRRKNFQRMCCSLCTYVAFGKKELKSHKSCHEKQQVKKYFSCPACPKQFSSLHRFEVHAACHLQNVNYVLYRCISCDFNTNNSELMSGHFCTEENNSRPGQFASQMMPKKVASIVMKCVDCDFITFFPLVLKDHMKTHSGSDLYSVGTTMVASSSQHVDGESILSSKSAEISELSDVETEDAALDPWISGSKTAEAGKEVCCLPVQKPLPCVVLNKTQQSENKEMKRKIEISIPRGNVFWKKAQCPKCDFGSFFRTNIIRHVRMNHSDDVVVIDSIEESVDGKSSPQDSCEVPLSERLDEKELADKGKFELGSRSLHYMLSSLHESHQQMPYRCKCCAKCFVSKIPLHNHLLHHLTKVLWKCVSCDFKSNDHCCVLKHAKIHHLRRSCLSVDGNLELAIAEVAETLKSKPLSNISQKYFCPLGGGHMEKKLEGTYRVTNSGIACSFCHDCFSSKYRAHYHILSKHLHIALIKCCYCDFSGLEKYKIIKHIKEEHGNQPIDIEGIGVDIENEVKKYLLTNPLKAADKLSPSIRKTGQLGSDDLDQELQHLYEVDKKSSKLVCLYCQWNCQSKYSIHHHILEHVKNSFADCPFCEFKEDKMNPISKHLKVCHQNQRVKSVAVDAEDCVEKISDESGYDQRETDKELTQDKGDNCYNQHQTSKVWTQNIGNTTLGKHKSHSYEPIHSKIQKFVFPPSRMAVLERNETWSKMDVLAFKAGSLTKYKCRLCQYMALTRASVGKHFLQVHKKTTPTEYLLPEKHEEEEEEEDNKGENRYGCSRCTFKSNLAATVRKHMLNSHSRNPDGFKVLGSYDRCSDKLESEKCKKRKDIHELHQNVQGQKQAEEPQDKKRRISEEHLQNINSISKCCNNNVAKKQKDETVENQLHQKHGILELMQCAYCTAKFTSVEGLSGHIALCHKGRKFEYSSYALDSCCVKLNSESIVGKSNPVAESLVKSEPLSDEETNTWAYLCRFCDFQEMNCTNMRYHLAEHLLYRPYSCGVCQRLFSDPNERLSHAKKYHQGVKTTFKVCRDQSKEKKLRKILYECKSLACQEQVPVRENQPSHSCLLEGQNVQGLHSAYNTNKGRNQRNKKGTFYCFYCDFCGSCPSSLKVHHRVAHNTVDKQPFLWVDAHTGYLCAETCAVAGKEHTQDYISKAKAGYLCGYCTFRSSHRETVAVHQIVHKQKLWIINLNRTTSLGHFEAERKLNSSSRVGPGSGKTCYCCPACSFKVESLRLYRIHLATHRHVNFMHSPTNMPEVRHHMSTRWRDWIYRCGYCVFDSPREKDIRFHLERKHRTVPEKIIRYKREKSTLENRVTSVNLDPCVLVDDMFEMPPEYFDDLLGSSGIRALCVHSMPSDKMMKLLKAIGADIRQ